MNKGSRDIIKKKTAVLVLLAIYLLGVLLGCFIIWAFPVYRNKAYLLSLAQEKGEQILSAGLKEPPMLFGMEHLLFNESGNLISAENQFLNASQRGMVRECLPELFEKGILFKPTRLLLEGDGNGDHKVAGIILGVVVDGKNDNRFASILLREFSDMETNMLTYAALYTIMYAVAMAFVFVIVQKEWELNRMRRDLIANVSHELKTPITAIRAMAEVLHDGMAKDEKTRQTYSGKIMEEADHLEQLVLDIMELSKLQSKRTAFKKNRTHADGIIPPVIDRYMMLCGDLGITLDTSGLNLEDVPVLYTDQEKLVTLMTILLDNAVKFTGKGGQIWVSNQIHAKHTVFCIRDNGPGIRNEDLGRIFERFYKADIAHNSAGSGLGLAIADEIAKGLGERLWVESKFGVGSAFYFTVGY